MLIIRKREFWIFSFKTIYLGVPFISNLDGSCARRFARLFVKFSLRLSEPGVGRTLVEKDYTKTERRIYCKRSYVTASGFSYLENKVLLLIRTSQFC